MIVSGDEAKRSDAVRLDNFESINGPGKLVFADDVLGVVKWLDRAETAKEITLGAHAIRIVPHTMRGSN